MKSLLLAAAAGCATFAVAGAAQAQCCGELPAPAYAYSGYDYAGAEYGANHFTLAGVRAGVTVLGVDLDAHAGLDIGAHGWGSGYRYAAPRAPVYAPPPPPAPYGYQGGYAGGYGYEAQPAFAPSYEGGYGRSYDVPCGCGW